MARQLARIVIVSTADDMEPAGRRIPVVDDDPSVRRVMVETLEYEGFDVLEAPDGAAACRLIAEPESIPWS